MTTGNWVRAAAIAAALAVSPSLASAATIGGGYTENFNSYATGDTAVTGFTESNTAAYTIQADTVGNDYQAAQSVSTNTGANASSGISFTDATKAVLQNNVLTVSTKLTQDALSFTSGATINAGLGLFGTVADFSNTTSNSQYRLLVTFGTGNVGKLTITEQSNTTGLTGTTTSAGSVSVAAGTVYTLTAQAYYVGDVLYINGAITDGTNTATIAVGDATPTAGTFFGYRTALNQTQTTGTTAYNVDYDDFNATLTVPEPTSAAALGLAAVGLLARRRRAI